jgi:hypothetical protein
MKCHAVIVTSVLSEFLFIRPPPLFISPPFHLPHSFFLFCHTHTHTSKSSRDTLQNKNNMQFKLSILLAVAVALVMVSAQKQEGAQSGAVEKRVKAEPLTPYPPGGGFGKRMAADK